MATPQYTKDAINRYNAKFDRVAVNLPKGTKNRIFELTGSSCNAFIRDLVTNELDRLESKNNSKPESTENNIVVPDELIALVRKAYGQKTKIQNHVIELIEDDLDEMYVNGVETAKAELKEEIEENDDGELPDFMK